MIWNYIKIALRTIRNNKLYSLINIFGLAIALTVSFLMFLWVNDELTTDRFHENSDRLYRVKRTIPLENQVLEVYEGISYPLLKEGKLTIPEIEEFIPLGRPTEENIVYGDKIIRSEGSFANSAFFKSFSYPLIIGDYHSLDVKMESIVISKSLAERIFGNDWANEALGKIINIHNKDEFIIEAVYEDFPGTSSIQNEFYYSLDHHIADNKWLLEWGNNGMQGAFLLTENADPTIAEQKLHTLFQQNIGGDVKEGSILQLYADDYLYGKYNDKAEVIGGRIEYVRIFMISAFLLLIISCVNFINLATVIATKRRGEIGIRKAIGAKKKILFTQFMTEAAAITFIALLFSMGIAKVLLPKVNTLTGKSLEITFNDPKFWIGLIGIFALTTLLSGLYPSLILASYKPVNVLKKKTEGTFKGLSFRKGLVILQFGLTTILIISATGVSKQINYIQNKNLGIDKNNFIYINQDKEITSGYDGIRNELISSEGIDNVTMAGPDPLNMVASTSGIGWPGKITEQENIEFHLIWTTDNFAETFNLEIKDGSYYRKGRKLDTSSIVLNEKAIAIMGIEDPVGKTINLWGTPREIVGVVKDFHNQSLHEEIKPAGFILDAERAGTLYIKTKPGETETAINSIKSVFASVVPNLPLHFSFLDETYQEIYSSELLIGKLANYFAFISILISCLGLFGLATFLTEQRKKEISIRKVLGASLSSILQLLSRDFMKLVLVSLFIAFPIAWFIMNKWLNTYAYSTNLGWMIFLFAGLGAIILVLFSTGYQALKAGIENPARTLRSE